MSLMSSHGSNTRSTDSMISDLISDYAAHAPEPDTAILAPELRGGSIAPEVSRFPGEKWLIHD